MPVAVQHQQISLNNPSYTFTFSNDVAAWIVGISNFELTYGDTDYWVQKLSLGLAANQTGAMQVTVDVSAELLDNSGHSIDNANSTVTVAILAWLGSVLPELTLTSPGAVSNNQYSSNIPVPCGTLSQIEGVLSGFDLAYPTGTNGYEVQAVQIGPVGVSPEQNNFVSLTGTAYMNDSSSHSADGTGGTTATFTPSLIATSLTEPGFVAQLTTRQSSTSVALDFSSQLGGASIVDAVALINGFTVRYDTNYWVLTIAAGTQGWSINGSNVELNNAQAQIGDNSGHSQDDSISNVTLLVIAVPNPQIIASVVLSNYTFTPNTSNGVVGTITVNMTPESPAFSGTLSISGNNSGGFVLSGTTLQQPNGGTKPGTYTDITITATEEGIANSQQIQPRLVGRVGGAG